jgi:hypothetical protein
MLGASKETTATTATKQQQNNGETSFTLKLYDITLTAASEI